MPSVLLIVTSVCRTVFQLRKPMVKAPGFQLIKLVYSPKDIVISNDMLNALAVCYYGICRA